MVKKISIIKTVIIIVFSCILNISLTVAIFIYTLLNLLGDIAEHRMSIPPSDSKYISRLGFYARDSLPSCKVVQKKYMEGQYTSAVYRLDSTDFAKVLNGIHQERRFFADTDLDTIIKFISEDTIVEFNKNAIELLRKENIEVEELDLKYNLEGWNRLGFKYPDLVVFDQTLYD